MSRPGRRLHLDNRFLEPLEGRLLLAGPAYATLTRTQARDWYLDLFAPIAEVAPSWTGSVVEGDAGTIGATYASAVLARFNAYRYMAGLPDDVTLDATFSQKAQAAALMMSANRALSHTPPTTWTYYTADGAQAAGSSNLFLGLAGPSAIDGYMSEGAPAGHRRWILYPPEDRIGIGEIPTPDGGYPPSNVTYVIGGFGDRPDVPFVAWPSPGFLPWRLVPDAWSFAADGPADFSSATVTVLRNGATVPTTIVSRGLNYGDPALEWTVSDVGRIRPSADASYEVTVGNVKVNGQFQNYTYTVTIYDPAPTSFQFEKDWSWSFEGDGVATFTVLREGDASGAVSVSYATLDGTAKAGQDFTAASGTLDFAAGQTSRTISVPLTNDGVDATYWEGFDIVLSAPSRGTELGNRSRSSWTVGDSDGVHAWLNFSVTTTSVDEGARSVALEVSRGGGDTQSNVSVSYATQDGTAKAGQDFTATTGSLPFGPGVLKRTITVPILDDTGYDPGESFKIVLSNPTGGGHLGEYDTKAASATVTIADNDPAVPVLGFVVASADVAEGAGSVALEVVRTGNTATGTVAVSFATTAGTAAAGDDFTTTTGVLQFAPGQTSRTIVVPIADDSLYEGPETFTIALSNPTGGAVLGAKTSAIVTIGDDDPEPSTFALAKGAYSVAEASGSVSVVVTRQGGTSSQATVAYATTDGTAKAGTDYSSRQGTLVFAVGQTSRTIVIPILNDTRNEGNEAFTVALTGPTTGGASLGGITSATVTIGDDDPPDLTPPSTSIASVVPDPRATAVPSVTITFSEPVVGFDLADLRLTVDLGPNLLTGSETLTTTDRRHFILSNLAATTATLGRYVLNLRASGSGIADDSGNPLAGDAEISWTMRRPTSDDLDGDGEADLGVFQPGPSSFFLRQTSAGNLNLSFGQGSLYGGDPMPLMGDFDGDGRADLAVYQPDVSSFFVRQTTAGNRIFSFGQGRLYGGDPVPIAGDFDGDGKDDLGVYQPDASTFFLTMTTAGNQFLSFGQGRLYGGDPVPVVGDFDGDGRADLGVYQPDVSSFFLRQTTARNRIFSFGQGRLHGGDPMPLPLAPASLGLGRSTGIAARAFPSTEVPGAIEAAPVEPSPLAEGPGPIRRRSRAWWSPRSALAEVRPDLLGWWSRRGGWPSRLRG